MPSVTRCYFARTSKQRSVLKYNNVFFAGLALGQDSLYAREFHQGAYMVQHEEYMATLKKLGVLASEMEGSQVFTLAHVHNCEPGLAPVSRPNKNRGDRIIAGAILVVVGDDDPFAGKKAKFNPERRLIEVGLRSLVELFHLEMAPDPTPSQTHLSKL